MCVSQAKAAGMPLPMKSDREKAAGGPLTIAFNKTLKKHGRPAIPTLKTKAAASEPRVRSLCWLYFNTRKRKGWRFLFFFLSGCFDSAFSVDFSSTSKCISQCDCCVSNSILAYGDGSFKLGDRAKSIRVCY